MDATRTLYNQALNRIKTTLLALSVGAGVCTLAPIFINRNMPLPLRTLSLTTGLGLAVAGFVVSSNSERISKLATIENKIFDQKLRIAQENEVAFFQLHQQMVLKERIAGLVNQLEPHKRFYYLQQAGLQELIDLSGVQLPRVEAQQTIPIQAVAVDAPASMPAQVTPSVAPSGVVGANPFAGKFQVKPGDFFPTEDIAERVADMSEDASISGSILCACPRGSGKSSLLNGCIAAINKRHNGYVDFNIFNGKQLDNDQNYCGIEQSEEDYLFCKTDNVPELYRRLYALHSRLEENTEFPTVNILDEWNNTRLNAKTLDGLKTSKIKYLPQLDYYAYQHITQGRSKRFMDLITSHSPNVEDIGQNAKIRENMNFIVLARGERTSAVSNALRGGSGALIDSDVMREQLKQQWEEYRSSPSYDPNRVIALTNVGDDWRFIFLPVYLKWHPPIERGILNQSALEVFDDMVQSDSDDPYAYRYPASWGAIAQLSKVLTKGKCSFPGCCEDAAEVHHMRYRDEKGLSICENPQPGVDVVPLCQYHHGKDHPDAAHHPSNWIKGTVKQPLQIDSANTADYRARLIEGFREKMEG